MDDKKLLPGEEEVLEEDSAVEEANSYEQDVELVKRLRAQIKELEEKEKVVARKLSVAKETGLDETVAKCRGLLQRMVRYKIDLRHELEAAELRLREAEAKRTMERLTEEIGALTEEIDAMLPAVEEVVFDTPLFEEEYDHRSKAKRLALIAKSIAWLGILGGLIGALVYMLLVEGAYVAFSWWPGLATYGIGAVVLVVIGLIVGGSSRKHKRLAAEIAEQIEEERAAYEADRAEAERLAYEANAPWLNDNADSVIEAYAIERTGDRKRASKRRLQKLIPDTENDELKQKVHKIAPVAAACAAIAVVGLSVIGKRKGSKRSVDRSAALRREFYNWLG